MTAKEYLNQVRQKDIMINRLLKQKNELRDMLYSYGQQSGEGERVQTSAVRDRLGDIYAKIDEKEEEILRQIDELIDCKQIIISKIYNVTDERYEELLYMRYIEYKPFKAIANKMCYSYDHIRRIHSHALTDFENVNPEIKDATKCHI